MKFLSTLLVGILGSGILFTGGASIARADSGDVSAPDSASADASLPVATQPGTDAEARNYEQREAASPEVQEFAGGDVTIGVSLFAILLIVIIIILLSD